MKVLGRDVNWQRCGFVAACSLVTLIVCFELLQSISAVAAGTVPDTAAEGNHLVFLGGWLGLLAGLLAVGVRSGEPRRRSWRRCGAVAQICVAACACASPLFLPGSGCEAASGLRTSTYSESDVLVSGIADVVCLAVTTGVSAVVATSRHPASAYATAGLRCLALQWLTSTCRVLDFALTRRGDCSVAQRAVAICVGSLANSMGLYVIPLFIVVLLLRRIRALEDGYGRALGFYRMLKWTLVLVLVIAALSAIVIVATPSAHGSVAIPGAVILLEVCTGAIAVRAYYWPMWALRRDIRDADLSRPRRRAARWAAFQIRSEAVAAAVTTGTTAGVYALIAAYSFHRPTVLAIILVTDIDLVANACCVAMLSGLLPGGLGHGPYVSFQRARGRKQRKGVGLAQPAIPEASDPRWGAKVTELGTRGVFAGELLDFYHGLSTQMDGFDPEVSTTNDVVRRAIIPTSRSGDGGSALASVWSAGDARHPDVMVTHCWSNLFTDLVAAVAADLLGLTHYVGVAERLRAGGAPEIKRELEAAGLLDACLWICAFCVNQHAGICGGFGPEPQDEARRREWEEKRRDRVSGQVFQLCDCRQAKHFSNSPIECEMNKFDDMMWMMHAHTQGMRHLVAVDRRFDLFSRAWCLAEIIQADAGSMEQHIVVHSEESVLLSYHRLASLDIEQATAANQDDVDLILAKVADVDDFNEHLQALLMGDYGLLPAWLDGESRAQGVAKIAARSVNRKQSI